MAHPNEELLRRGYEAYANRDLEVVNEVFTDDIEWHISGDNPLAGDYRGKDEVLGLFARIDELSGGTWGFDVHDVLANDEHGVVLVKARAEREGRTIEDNTVHVWHFRDGKVSGFWSHPFDAKAVDAFWS